jgi:hypothetical protein
MTTESPKKETSAQPDNVTHFHAPVTGQIHTGSGNIVVGQSGDVGESEIVKAFSKLIQMIDALPESPDKKVAQSAVQALETEAKKGADAQETAVRKWLNFLAETSPDVWQVSIDTFINPIKGLSTAFQKIAERAKAEREAKKEAKDKASQEQQ